jgi:hypothetical protein
MGLQDQSVAPDEENSSPRPAANQGVVEGATIRLHSNPYQALKAISCDFHEGVLTLRGCLPTWHLKQMAQTAVACLDGVQRIVNAIEVVGGGRR